MKYESRQNAVAEADSQRRSLLTGIVVSYVSFFLPSSVQAQQSPDSDRDAFLKLSCMITGRSSLDDLQLTMLFTALAEDDPGFPQLARSLLQYVESHGTAATQLQESLDSERDDLAALPRIIATAWFMGVVGSESGARCIAYERALNNVIVADVLRPPTYCTGGYASWSAKPEPKVR